MIYKFKSKAAGDLVMLGAQGDEVLRLLGREPAPQGIIEVAALAGAIAALEAAVAAQAAPAADAEDDKEAGPGAVTLRQRAWPMVEMMKRSLAEQQPIVWGV